MEVVADFVFDADEGACGRRRGRKGRPGAITRAVYQVFFSSFFFFDTVIWQTGNVWEARGRLPVRRRRRHGGKTASAGSGKRELLRRATRWARERRGKEGNSEKETQAHVSPPLRRKQTSFPSFLKHAASISDIRAAARAVGRRRRFKTARGRYNLGI